MRAGVEVRWDQGDGDGYFCEPEFFPTPDDAIDAAAEYRRQGCIEARTVNVFMVNLNHVPGEADQYFAIAGRDEAEAFGRRETAAGGHYWITEGGHE